MTTKLAVTSVRVLDQEEALDFYVNKLGMEKGQDIRQGPFRWLTVRFPDDPDVEIFLEEPGPPVHDEATAEQLRDRITKGAMGLRYSIPTTLGACSRPSRSAASRISPRSPSNTATASTWGIRDPFGNAIRILQPARSRQRTMA